MLLGEGAPASTTATRPRAQPRTRAAGDGFVTRVLLLSR
jgi:hypothetical protein